jgi:transitional endoplasmic reticulum ATPase
MIPSIFLLITARYVGSDLASLCRETAMTAMRRLHKHQQSTTTTAATTTTTAAIPSTTTTEAETTAKITLSDFKGAMQRVVASSQRGSHVDVQPTQWSDIGGLTEVKEALRQVRVCICVKLHE